MIAVDVANPNDVDALVALESKLFREDAGVHDEFADVTWPDREGADDFARLLADPTSLVLAARDGASVVGLLVGYVAGPSSHRQPVTHASLRSMYLDAAYRRQGVGQQMVEQFLSWSRQQGCAEATVDHYAANDSAQRFYSRMGFAAQSVSAVLRL
jgi:ribosomal protein S18 acetylase RimI-like enzyme